MTDPTQFILNLSTVHRLLQHEGLIGIGKDFITDQASTIHTYSDKFKRSYVMQLYDNIETDFLSSKLNSIAKSAHSTFVSNMLRPLFMCTRKSSNKSYELAIFYDLTGLGYTTLETVIQSKRNSQQKFQSDEIVAFFWQIADFLMLTHNNSEYLQLTPINIITKIEGFYSYNFFPSNFGISYPKNKQKFYHNPKDKFWNGIKNLQTALSSTMFMFGMILLQLVSLLPTNQLYENNQINEKMLAKRIQASKMTNDTMISKIIKKLLVINEDARLKISEIYLSEQWLKLRKVVYFQSKHDFFQFKNFEGFVEYDKKTSIGEALDNNLCLYRGTFINGILEGRGVKQVKETLQMGNFIDNQFCDGQMIKKNSHIDIGKFKNGFIVQGIRFYLNISNTNKQSKGISGFIGQFEKGEPKTGRIINNDGSQRQI